MRAPDHSPLDTFATPSFAQLRSTRPRMLPVRGIVLHWTGGAGGPLQVYRTLRSRTSPRAPDGLSVHYVIGSKGEVVQMAPHDLVCLHAGTANEWSIGIEIVSPGLPRGAAYEREKKAGIAREVYRDKLRTKRRDIAMLDFTREQTESAIDLVERLCDLLRIRRALPTEGGELMRREMSERELARFEGVLGHYHCHPVKLDPGTRLLERLRQRWA